MTPEPVTTFNAVSAAMRPQSRGCVGEVLALEVPSAIEWRLAGSGLPLVRAVLADICRTLATKRLAIEDSTGEMRAFPNARLLERAEHLARWHGVTAGVGAAETIQRARALV